VRGRRFRAARDGSGSPRRRVAGLALPLLVSLLVVGGCGAGDPGPATGAGATGPPIADCAALAAPPAAPRTSADVRPPAAVHPPAAGRSAGRVAGSLAPGSPQPLPDVTLPCYAGGAPVRVSGLRGPAIVNLWASWCEPCRRELAVLQRYADRVDGRVHVIGVITEDTRDASGALAADLGLRFPQLYDRSAQLRRLLNRAALPITLLVDREGQIRLLYNAEALDDDTLDMLAQQYLGVPPAGAGQAPASSGSP
jgi:thiol-disulfide isomerase/thioredoxin